MKNPRIVSCLVFLASSSLANAAEPNRSHEMRLPVIELRSSFEPYASYCRRHPTHCDLTGPQIVGFNPETSRLLEQVNLNANSKILNASDMELYGKEEHWAFPSSGAGDCEDVALFKRERLVELGFPRAAMTIAIVHHQKAMFPHAVLLVETTAGTFLLDNLDNRVVRWHAAPYNFESRELPDGSWERYDQSNWSYE